MNRDLFGKNSWVIVVVILFGIVYQLSGTYVYIDGDDATSMAYHIMGRDDTIQPAYSAYHGMMDKMLSLLPAREALLRTLAFGTTRFANILMFILILMLVFDWLRTGEKNHTPTWHVITSVAVLFAAPEMLYFGLVYAPTFVAMCFVLSAHLILRWSCRKADISNRRRLFWYGASIILFGFGVAFRWNTATYGIVIMADLLTILSASSPLRRKLALAAGWGALALISSFLMIKLSGYGIGDIVKRSDVAQYVINQAGTSVPGSEVSLLEMLMHTALTLTPFFTPVFGLLTLFGLVKFTKERSPLLYVILAGLLSILPLLKTGVPKFIITSIPVFVLVFVAGLDVVVDFANRKRNKAFVYALLFLGLLTPWVVGVRITRGGVAWGPGFEVKPYDYQDVSVSSFDISFGAGMAFPTPEGVRPLYGHAYVLLGKWREHVAARSSQDVRAVNAALSLDIPLVSTSWSPDRYLNQLYSMEFRTSDPYERISPSGYFHERSFYNIHGKTFELLFTELDSDNVTNLVYYLNQITEYQKVVLTGYSKTLRALYLNHADAMQALGPNSAILDLEKLRSE